MSHCWCRISLKSDDVRQSYGNVYRVIVFSWTHCIINWLNKPLSICLSRGKCVVDTTENTDTGDADNENSSVPDGVPPPVAQAAGSEWREIIDDVEDELKEDDDLLSTSEPQRPSYRDQTYYIRYQKCFFCSLIRCITSNADITIQNDTKIAFRYKMALFA